jgi:hypothetical protein
VHCLLRRLLRKLSGRKGDKFMGLHNYV